MIEIDRIKNLLVGVDQILHDINEKATSQQQIGYQRGHAKGYEEGHIAGSLIARQQGYDEGFHDGVRLTRNEERSEDE